VFVEKWCGSEAMVPRHGTRGAIPVLAATTADIIQLTLEDIRLAQLRSARVAQW
jgi:hypothetical protein